MLVRSIIHVCDQGHTSLLAYIIQKLSEHQSIDTFLSYSEKYECLYKAVLNGHVKAVQKLHKAFISIDSKMASSIFRLAASKDQLDIIKYLIKNSANVNLLIPDSNGISALHLATLSLDIKTIKYLIERAKMPTYVRTNSGDSILHFAVKSKSAVSQRKYEVITYLVGIAPELIESLNNVTP